MPAQDAFCLRREGETVLCYSVYGKNFELCLEEEFDLGNGEIIRTEKFDGNGHLYFLIETPYKWFYVLFINEDGTLELRRFGIP